MSSVASLWDAGAAECFLRSWQIGNGNDGHKGNGKTPSKMAGMKIKTKISYETF